MEVINLHRRKSGSIAETKSGSLITKKMLALYLENNQELRITDKFTNSDITREILDPIQEKIRPTKKHPELLILIRQKPGVITEVKGSKAIRQKVLMEFIENNQKLQIIDKITNKDSNYSV